MTNMSFAQKSMWFLNALDKKSTSYVITIAYDLNGKLHVNALKQSIMDLQVRRTN